MDDNDIKQMLKGIEVPPPSEAAQKRAMDAANQAFEAHREKKRQGLADKTRPTRNPTLMWEEFIGRLSMKKAYVFAGSFAALAVVLALTTTHYSAIMRDIVPTDEKGSTPASAPVTVEEMTAAKSKDAPQQTAAALMAPPAAPMEHDVKPMPELKKEMAQASREKAGNAAGISRSMVMGDVVGQPYVPQYQSYYQGQDKFESFQANPVKLVNSEPVSTFSIDADTASYSFVRRELNAGILPPKDSVRVEEMVNYFDYNYPLPESKQQPFKPSVTVTATPWNKETKLLHIGIKGYDIAHEKPRSNLVFLIDVSGSMNSQDKLPLLKNSLRMLVDQLSADDTIGIVTYAGNSGTALEPTRVAEKQKIFAALDALGAGGSTAGAQGIEQAYALAQAHFDKKAVNRVILATDGDFNVGVTDPAQLQTLIEQKRESGIFLSILGFGEGNYNDALMQKLAQHGNGTAAYIDTLNEARKVLVEEAGSTLFTIAKDVKIQIEFNPSQVSEYRLIGYESRMLNREDFNNDKVDAGEVGSGHAVTAIYEITPVGAKPQADPLRYGATPESKPVADKSAFGGEYAFLKIRYKLPSESESKLLTTPVTKAEEVSDIKQASEDVRFAIGVAAFGQMLKGDTHVASMKYDDVIALAEPARGKDSFGYRAEFLNLVRLAKSLGSGQVQPQPEQGEVDWKPQPVVDCPNC